MPVSTAEEAEASGVPTGGPTLSTFTEDPGERVTPVSSSERMLRITCFREMVSVLGGSCHWPSSSVCKIQHDILGPCPSRH